MLKNKTETTIQPEPHYQEAIVQPAAKESPEAKALGASLAKALNPTPPAPEEKPVAVALDYSKLPAPARIAFGGCSH